MNFCCCCKKSSDDDNVPNDCRDCCCGEGYTVFLLYLMYPLYCFVPSSIVFYFLSSYLYDLGSDCYQTENFDPCFGEKNADIMKWVYSVGGYFVIYAIILGLMIVLLILWCIIWNIYVGIYRIAKYIFKRQRQRLQRLRDQRDEEMIINGGENKSHNYGSIVNKL
jgi:hypothetical protein